MKRLIVLIAVICCFSCEDVIEVSLPNESPRLVIEAFINWFENSDGASQQIQLSLTAPYFDENIPAATGARVVVTDEYQNVFDFVEDGETGIYKTSSFIPQLNAQYSLSVTYEGEVYTATETLMPTVPFDFVEQDTRSSFGGEEIEVKAFFTDPINQNDYYFFETKVSTELNPILDAAEDEFFDGNQVFALYSEEELAPGDQISFVIHGSSKQFYDYISLLLQQLDSGGGPFQTQPATVRGNCINETNPDNFPLGYFRLSQAFETSYIVQ